ncbi:MAG: acetoacetate--CoA ligase [Thaumarchaeota archaeon]|nr:acetoacetate--CoA ligase [Nitrososphaerota archaeon]
MAEPKVLWEPSPKVVASANITTYARWLEEEKKVRASDFPELWSWSVQNLDAFQESVWQYFRIRSSEPYNKVLESRTMPGARWFPGSKLNYAEHIFREKDPAKTALITKTESEARTQISWAELERKTAAFAGSLKAMGVQKGDRVAAYLPNVPETIVALLACSSIGAIWSSCAPDFGTQSAVERFKQIDPKILIAAYGYNYRGKWSSKTEVVEHIRSSIPSIEKTVMIGPETSRIEGVLHWEDHTKSKSKLEFEQVPFDHPLWIVYSSGTTGLPKPIVHGHGGILLEHFKTLSFHNDLKPADRMFWYTSTGWMMWNYLVSALLLDSTIILYEGDPFYPNANSLWDLADETGMTFLGASAAYVGASIKSGVDPILSHSLKGLRGFGSTGSALTTDGFEWIYSHVKKDIWVASISGGSDLCTAFVGGCPILPVRSGEIQCRNLGADIAAFDEQGHALVGEMGELVIREPMPSMPLFLWGDATGERYRESYFSHFPGVWRHGDWIRINEDGSCIIYGRSDATIKKMGVRMGTSEVYRVVESVPRVVDSILVDMEFLGGRSYMPLFIVLRGGAVLDESLRAEIGQKIRKELSPKMLPDEIVAVPEIPRTLNGKKMEVPLRRIFLGADPAKVYNPGSLKNPASMDFFIEFARRMSR